jgi:hypothetical protein
VKCRLFWLKNRCSAAALLALGSLIWPAVSLAQTATGSDSIALLVDRADFEGASALVASMLASGKLNRSEAARVHLFAGVIAAARRNTAEANAEFEKALQLDSSIALPASAGPHVVASFEAARTELTRQPALTISVELARGRAPSELALSAHLSGNQGGLLQKLVLHSPKSQELLDINEPGLQVSKVVATMQDCSVYSVGAADQFGNELWPDLASLTLCPPAAAAPAPAPVAVTASLPPVQPAAPGMPLSIELSAGVSASLAIASGVLGGVALHQRAEFNDKNEDLGATVADRREARDRAALTQHLATGAAVLAVAAAVPVVWYFVSKPKSPAKVGLRATLTGAELCGEL